MAGNETGGENRVRGLSRRRFVKAAGASGLAVGIAGCADGDGDDGATPINTEPPQEDITVKFAADDNFKQVADELNKLLHDNGLPENITVEFLGDSFNTDDRRTKYNQVLNDEQKEPALLMMGNGWTIPFIARGQLQNLTKALPAELTEEANDRYFESSVATATGADGDLYGIPLFADFPTMQYRKDLMREAGYTDDDFETWATDPPTWQEFSRAVKETMDATGKDGYNFQASTYEGLSCCDFVEWMSSWGGAYFGGRENLFGPVGDRPITVEEEPVINAINMVRHFIHGNNPGGNFGDYAGGISPQAVVRYTEETSRQPFTNGDVIAHRNWPYSININGAEDAFGEDLGVMPLPYAVTEGDSKYEGIGGTSSALGGWHIAMNPNATDEQKRAAVAVIRAFMQDEVMLGKFELGAWIPPVPELVASDEAKEFEIIGRYVEQLKIAGENSVPRPVTVVWSEESAQISMEVNATFRQEKPASKAMADLAGTLEQIESQA